MILLICGEPDQGKTTIAEAIAKKTKVPIIHLDKLFLAWCESQKLPYTINVLGTWQEQDKNTKNEFKEYLISHMEQLDLIIEGWQLGTNNILSEISKKHSCIVIKMWLKEAYHNDRVIGNKDKLDTILKLCGF
jgi:cytidylate kinase